MTSLDGAARAILCAARSLRGHFLRRESAIGEISRLCSGSSGVFRGQDAVRLGISRKRLSGLVASGVIERVLPGTYRMTAVAPSRHQSLRAALLWAGPRAAAAGVSAGELYGLDGIAAQQPEIVVPVSQSPRAPSVIVHRVDDVKRLMIRQHRGVRVTGPEATLLALGATLDTEAFEIACEDARRRRLTSVPALRTYLATFGGAGRPGVAALRGLLDDVDPVHAARSVLEVKARRLLVASGFTEFVREFPLDWRGRTYRFDFAFVRHRTILETNGRRWHDDANDYESDNDKWSVPGRHGYRLVLATWDKVTRSPAQLVTELATTFAAGRQSGRMRPMS